MHLSLYFKGAIDAGVSSVASAVSPLFNEKEASECTTYLPIRKRSSLDPVKVPIKVRVDEPEDTASMTNTQLQRLVLLEQLKYFRAKNRLLEDRAFDNSNFKFVDYLNSPVDENDTFLHS